MFGIGEEGVREEEGGDKPTEAEGEGDRAGTAEDKGLLVQVMIYCVINIFIVLTICTSSRGAKLSPWRTPLNLEPTLRGICCRGANLRLKTEGAPTEVIFSCPNSRRLS